MCLIRVAWLCGHVELTSCPRCGCRFVARTLKLDLFCALCSEQTTSSVDEHTAGSRCCTRLRFVGEVPYQATLGEEYVDDFAADVVGRGVGVGSVLDPAAATPFMPAWTDADWPAPELPNLFEDAWREFVNDEDLLSPGFKSDRSMESDGMVLQSVVDDRNALPLSAVLAEDPRPNPWPGQAPRSSDSGPTLRPFSIDSLSIHTWPNTARLHNDVVRWQRGARLENLWATRRRADAFAEISRLQEALVIRAGSENPLIIHEEIRKFEVKIDFWNRLILECDAVLEMYQKEIRRWNNLSLRTVVAAPAATRSGDDAMAMDGGGSIAVGPRTIM